jgi:hypothetical protein
MCRGLNIFERLVARQMFLSPENCGPVFSGNFVILAFAGCARFISSFCPAVCHKHPQARHKIMTNKMEFKMFVLILFGCGSLFPLCHK